MGIYRHGAHLGFFDGTTAFNQSTNPGGGVGVTAGAFSKAQQLGQGSDNFSFFVSVTGAPAFATRWQLQVAHSGDPTVQGNLPDQSGGQLAGVWHDAWYLGTSGNGNSTSIWIDIPSGGGSVMTFCPDFSGGWARLHRTDANGAVTVTAGWEEMSD